MFCLSLIRWRISVLHFLFIYVWYWGGKTKELCNLDLKQQLKFDLMDSNFRNQGKIIVLPRPCLPWNQCRTRNVSLLAPMPSFSCETLTNSGISDVKHQRNWTKKKSTSRQLGTPRKTCSCHSWLPSKQPDQSKQGALLVFYSSIIYIWSQDFFEISKMHKNMRMKSIKQKCLWTGCWPHCCVSFLGAWLWQKKTLSWPRQLGWRKYSTVCAVKSWNIKVRKDCVYSTKRKCKTCRSVISFVLEFIQAILPHVNFTWNSGEFITKLLMKLIWKSFCMNFT